MKGSLRGQFLFIDKGAEFVLFIFFIGILLGAGTIAATALNTGQAVNTSAWYAVNNASLSVVNVSVQLPTIGLVAGVALVFAILIGGTAIWVFRGS